jgi:acyl-CoA reductase-like NAD-dependent aldehyde dehydrogenase
MSDPWGKVLVSDRGILMFKLGALIEKHADALTEAESQDNGKLRSEVGIEAVKEYLETKSVWMSSDLDMPDPFIRKY